MSDNDKDERYYKQNSDRSKLKKDYEKYKKEKEKKLKESKEKWTRYDHDIYQEFVCDVCEFWDKDAKPQKASKMIINSLKLQKERLDEKGLSVHYDIEPRGVLEDTNLSRKWQDDRYINDKKWRSCTIKREYLKDGKKIYSDTEKDVLYETITNYKDINLIAHENYPCPKCGAVSTVKQLEEKCPFCGAHFEMGELYPKVTNYYAIEDTGRSEKEVKKEILKYMIPVGIAFLVYWFYHYYFISSKELKISIIEAVIAGAISGVIFGYLLFAIVTISKMFFKAAGTIPMLFNITGSRKKFERMMKSYDPGFSYEYFSDKVVSIVKMLLFCRNLSDCAYYVPEAGVCDDCFGNIGSDDKKLQIVDAAFKGAIALKSIRIMNECAFVIAEVYMTNYYYNGRHIKKKNEKIRVRMTKNLTNKFKYNFSLTAVTCGKCGAGFDASLDRKCPYCGEKYHIGVDEWIVTGIERK